MSLKERKEAFVSGLEGGTILEVCLVTLISPLCYLCWQLVRQTEYNHFFDFAVTWLPLLLSMTVYGGSTELLITLMIIPCLLVFMLGRISKTTGPGKTKMEVEEKEDTFKDKRNQVELVKRSFITAYRGTMLIVTMLAILAVDFNVFPRRFAKVETWGTSLMDLGVGSFVFSNGVVSARSLIKQKIPGFRQSFLSRLVSAFKSGGVLLLLGLFRLYFVKQLDYQEHVTEYGVHWNFFLTLSLLAPIVTVFIDPVANYIPRVVLALAISIAYEMILFYNDKAMLTFMILGERTNFFSANREGIMSFLGYCAIFLWGQNAGFYILIDKPTKNNFYKPSATLFQSSSKSSRNVTKWDTLTSGSSFEGLLLWTIVTAVISNTLLILHPHDVSRRFANIVYTFWVVSFNTGFLMLFSLVDKLFDLSGFNYSVPLSFEAVNSNGLLMFLLSNISTGLINLTISTIDQSDMMSMLILIAYSLFLYSVSVFFYKKGIIIKL